MAEKYRKLHWTEHSKIKMRQYGLSKSKLIQLLHKPERRELGIVPGTNAVMQPNKSYSKAKVHKPNGEIWLMYKDVKDPSGRSGQVLRKIISAWRYPGVTKVGESIPIPDDIRQELLKNGIE